MMLEGMRAAKKPRCVLAIALLSSPGCAITDVTLATPAVRVASMVSGGRGRQVVVVQPFEDARQADRRCGMKKNSYNMDTADVRCAEEPARWLATMLARELEQAGFEVADAGGARPSAVQLEGSLLQIFIEPVIGMWTVKMEADLHVKLVARSETGLAAERSFYVKSTESQFGVSTFPFDAALANATQTLLRDVVQAIVELLDRYPELGSHGFGRGVIRLALGKAVAP